MHKSIMTIYNIQCNNSLTRATLGTTDRLEKADVTAIRLDVATSRVAMDDDMLLFISLIRFKLRYPMNMVETSREKVIISKYTLNRNRP